MSQTVNQSKDGSPQDFLLRKLKDYELFPCTDEEIMRHFSPKARENNPRRDQVVLPPERNFFCMMNSSKAATGRISAIRHVENSHELGVKWGKATNFISKNLV